MKPPDERALHIGTAGLAAVVFMLFAVPAMAQNDTTVAVKERQLRERITTGLNALVERLETEASIGSGVAAQVNSVPTQEVPNVIASARTRHSGISQLIAAAPFEAAEQAATPAVAEASRRIAANDLQKNVTELRQYTQRLRELQRSAQSAPIDQVLQRLENELVPGNVAIVVGPSGPAPQAPPGALQPFSDSTPPPALTEDLLPFVVGLGATTVDFPAVGAIQFIDSASGALVVKCTGSLVAPNVVLTANHCMRAGTPQSVFFQHAGTYAVHQPPLQHPNFHFPEHDLMLLYLDKRVPGITPVDLIESGSPGLNAPGRIIGFGQHRPFSTPNSPPPAATAIVRQSGVKLYAQITTNACDANLSGKHLICWTYPSTPLNPLDGSTCQGDSGGPLLVASDTWRLAGVTSAGNTCLPGDRAVDVDVHADLQFIRDGIKNQPVQLTEDNTNLHFLLPVINSPDRYPVAVSERILDSTGTWQKDFSVNTDLNAIRFAINAIPSGTNLSITVTSPKPDVKCDEHVDGTATSCPPFVYPPQGTWSIRIVGAPFQEFQVVATVF